MGNRKGSAYLRRGIMMVRITTDRADAPKPRWAHRCPDHKDGRPRTQAEAKLFALELQERYDRREWDPWAKKAPEVKRASSENVSVWFARWLDIRAKTMSSVRSDVGRFNEHIKPVIGSLPMIDVTREHIETIVSRLDTRSLATGGWKTALNAWALLRAMFRDARNAKDRTLRVREDNPSDGVHPPDRGVSKVKQYLWPNEFMKLVSCTSIPLHWRRVYALSVYLFPRLGELEALSWDDIDLSVGVVHIHCALHYDTNAVKPIKTKESRRFTVEPAVLPLLRAMHAECSGRGRVWPVAAVRNNDAMLLRAHLHLAGVTRVDLFITDATRKNITAHDLRSTGITWRVVRGDDAVKIQRAAGHASFTTTSDYIREAENVRDGFGMVFPPLPATLCATLGSENDESIEGNRVRGGGLESAASEPSGTNRLNPSVEAPVTMVNTGQVATQRATCVPDPALALLLAVAQGDEVHVTLVEDLLSLPLPGELRELATRVRTSLHQSVQHAIALAAAVMRSRRSMEVKT